MTETPPTQTTEGDAVTEEMIAAGVAVYERWEPDHIFEGFGGASPYAIRELIRAVYAACHLQKSHESTTVLDRIAILTAKEHDPLAFDGDHLPDKDMEQWRRIVETTLRVALDIFLQPGYEP